MFEASMQPYLCSLLMLDYMAQEVIQKSTPAGSK